jgi:hypothetical protein
MGIAREPSSGSVTFVTPSRPRTSNLRLRRQFTEHDEDRFLDETFEYVANFFEASLTELEVRSKEIQARYRRVDANHFQAAVYRLGRKEAACRVWVSTADTRGILYSAGDSDDDRSYGECLTICNDGQMLLLEATIGLVVGPQGRQQFSQEGAAEYLWSAFISPLQ